jgi:hypothetical protein
MSRIAQDISVNDCDDLEWMIDYINSEVLEPEMKKAYLRLIKAAIAQLKS